MKMSIGLPVGAVMNCADNTGAKNLYVISVKGARSDERATLCRASCYTQRPPPLPFCASTFPTRRAHSSLLSPSPARRGAGWGARLNRLPGASAGDMFMGPVKKGKPDLRKKGARPAATPPPPPHHPPPRALSTAAAPARAVMPGVVVRQRKPWRRKDGLFIYFEGAPSLAGAPSHSLPLPPLPSTAPHAPPPCRARRQRRREREPEGRDEGCATAPQALEAAAPPGVRGPAPRDDILGPNSRSS